ncbi:MAG: HAD family phosphatase [Clostridia bacterium]|nr:HAD family phosphatase [Clostridia bacterium]
MIKNLIFDFGQVMIKYKPTLMAAKYIDDPEDEPLINEVLFDRLYWDRLDDGSITDEEIIEAARARLPERLHSVLPTIYYNWIYNLPEVEGMNALVADLRHRYGVGLYLLSNISEYFADNADEIRALRLFDRCFFSAKMGMTKPDPEIFLAVCRELGIEPSETLFIDDNARNIAGARSAGLEGYLFDGDAKKLGRYLEEVLTR